MSTLKASNIQPPSDSDPLVLSTNATQRLRIDTSGNVGIGTASPGSALEVKSFVSSATAGGITGTVANTGILLDVDFQAPAATRYSSGLFWRDSALGSLPLAGIWAGDENSNGASLLFGTSQTYANGINKIGMTVRNGLVGIGVTGPVAALDVSGISGSGRQVWIRSGNGGALASAAGAGMKLEYVGASNYGSIQPYDYSTSTPKNLSLCVLGGNVGIGTDSPSVALDVVGEIKSSSGLTVTSGSVSLPTTSVSSGLTVTSGSVSLPTTSVSSGLTVTSGGLTVTSGSVSLPTTSLSGDALTSSSVALSKLATTVLGAASISSTIDIQSPADANKSLAIGQWTAMKVTSGLTIGVAGHTWFVIFVRNNTDSQLGVYKFTGTIVVSALCNAVGMPVSTLYLIACRVA